MRTSQSQCFYLAGRDLHSAFFWIVSNIMQNSFSNAPGIYPLVSEALLHPEALEREKHREPKP
ncbi:MAG: hypothetical protein LBQ75_09050 [Zoogloeaceae bacterium]|nr:hypothetical protein [Zoogloeaceae bacterium]